MAAIQGLGQPEDGREGADGLAALPRQIAHPFMRPLRRRAAVIARDERNRLDHVGLETAQIAVLDQVVRMPVVTLVADVHADVVQERGVLQPLALAVGERVRAPRGIEQRK